MLLVVCCLIKKVGWCCFCCCCCLFLHFSLCLISLGARLGLWRIEGLNWGFCFQTKKNQFFKQKRKKIKGGFPLKSLFKKGGLCYCKTNTKWLKIRKEKTNFVLQKTENEISKRRPERILSLIKFNTVL